MPKPFHELTLDQFADLLSQFAFTRKVESVHVHHTWRPNHANFAAGPPLRSIEGMFNFHTQTNGWSDIAQHVTIDPRGIIWTGRSWNRPPASSTGFNGTTVAGPFMFEMIGDFDTGKDPFSNPQKAAAIGVVAHLLERFRLPASAIKFHHEMTTKTCPGSGIDKAAFVREVEAAQAVIQAAAGTPRAFGGDVTEMRQRSLQIIARWDTQPAHAERGLAEEELREETMNAADVQVLTGEAAPSSRGLFGETSAGFTPEEKQILRQHVVNLRLGVFSDSGKFETSLADVERIFGELLPAELASLPAGQPLRLVFYAHGGLVSEESGIRPVLRRLPFWRQNGLYPIFFCWETGLKETVEDLIGSIFKGQRGFLEDGIDAALEFAAGAAGRQVWSQMKRASELASLPGGGARTVAELTRDFWNDHHDRMEIHALGHSAGSIFHCDFLPMLLERKAKAGVPDLRVESLHFLAPAVTTALFEASLLPLIGPGKRIRKHTMYTMNKDLEKADKAGPYNKSLLYFVSRAFETGTLPAPILGLQESLEKDPKLIRFYGLARTTPGVAKILYSKTAADAPLDSRTSSTSHGDFDNEVDTMNSVARRMLDAGSIVSFVDETGRSEASRALTAKVAMPAFRGETTAPGMSASGARRALCMGIDAYPAPNELHGCVADTRSWAETLRTLGFEVNTLLNQDVTHAAILAAMGDLVSRSRPGDVLVIQYSGHGTFVQDLDGDEATGNDQALVPADFATGRFVIDDEIRAVMQSIPEGVNVTCFMDCCHSGSNTRMFGLPDPPLPPGTKARFLLATPAMNEAHLNFRRSTRAVAAPSRSVETMREVNFAACQPHEKALETSAGGDFTLRATRLLRSGAGGLTNQQFQDRLIEAFGPAARQRPLFDGGTGAGARALLSPLGAPAPVRSADTDLLRRLDAIEARLTRLGA